MQRVLVIVCASVAAMKAPFVLRRIREAGFETRVIATDSALNFVTPLALSSASGNTVFTQESWFSPQAGAQHLELAHWADAVVVVAASADFMARAALGFGDDLGTATLLSVRAPVLWAPAMNPGMWEHPATRAHRETLQSWGHRFIGPTFGKLGTKGEGEGMGRMLEPEEIAEHVKRVFAPKDMVGRKVLISAGPTREYLDPVRFISNPSSGKMGFAVAEEALSRGAEVVIVSGPVSISAPVGATVVPVESAMQMRDAMEAHFEWSDVVVMTAAVADYRAAEQKNEKQAKVSEHFTIELVPNPDILSGLGSKKGNRVLVGFAMETHAGVERAAGKARRKNADFICLNYPTREGTAFGGDDNQVTFVFPDGTFQDLPRMSKREVAEHLLDEALKRMQWAIQQPE
ncbi:bifunctional phosphopantothenoylcysteine decarboxylase/phosphopantothenate--cysteine ligase CoaBC [Deinococcus cellulosilyticus]|nr:bifunctional phosphopantothenoylcysteine decarboxylase/phosphopantothenate--cysteine ligase CoaBC [Deinococcus cellulosilyticus]